LIFGVIFGPIAYILYSILKPKNSQEEIDFIRVEHKFYYNQASKVADCMKCNAYVLEGHSYCTNCGTQNRFKCSKCGALTDYDDLYCFNCGLDFKGRRESLLQKYQKKANENLKKKIVVDKKQNQEKSGSTISNTIKPQFDYLKSLQSKVQSKLGTVKEKSKNLAKNVSAKVQTLKAQTFSKKK
jgi:RNA polymerase subunit RPABC4/transcription elongation factor Spt4